MKFHLNYNPPLLAQKTSHEDKILMLGSCFAENIGEYLTDHKFNCEINPNGILFNPISISNALTSYFAGSDQYPIIKNNDLFFSLDHHGDLCFKSEQELNKAISLKQQKAQQFLKETDWLILTFGSAYVYRHLKSDHIVANCHKLPQDQFKKELLSTEEILKEYTKLIQNLRQFNPHIKILLTVSPVKYLRDGVVENSLSKAVLIQSVHQIMNANSNCFYFPAYELVSDDLRDYRFYKEDMAHPNETAIQYVCDKFSECAFSEDTKKLNLKLKDILQASKHRPIHKDTSDHSEFKKKYLQKTLDLQKELPQLDLEKEKSIFK